MGKEFHEQAVDVELESYHCHNDDPGCMGAIFDYHHWYNVKKMFPHRGRHGGCCASPRTMSMERCRLIETRVLLHDAADHLQVTQQTRKTGSTTNKSSNNDSTKELTGKEKHKQWIPGFSATPQPQQTYSTHYFEHSGFGFGWMIPIILINKRARTLYSSSTSSRADTSTSKKLEIHDRMNSGKHAKMLDKEVKEGLDVLEVLKVNKDLFLDILQDPRVSISQYVPGKQTSGVVKLTRSRSFPVSGLPCTRYLQFGTLEHKQKEVWPFRQGEKPAAGTQSFQGSDSQRWNRLLMNRLKDFKQRIKRTFKQISMKDVNNKCRNEDTTDNDICNGGINRMRRTKSVNESLDRYMKLFEHGVSKEADLHQSTCLRLSKEDQVPSKELHGPKIFRSISSLSDINPFRSLLHVVSRDALSLEMPIESILNYGANRENDAHNEPKSIHVHEGIDKFELVEVVIEAELQEKLREGNNHDSSSTDLSIYLNGEDIAKPCDLAMEKISPRQEQESASAGNPSRELTEGETESCTFLKERPAMVFESNKEGDLRYNYVRDILELSGFVPNEGLHSWHSPDQPLNPSLFNELDCSSIDELGTSNHRLAFDLVNEALVEMSEKTCIYFPKPFSCGISLMAKGNIVVQEVWRKVGRNLGFQPEHDESLDDIVGRDLKKDAWIMLHVHAEFVAFELEELVFNELVDELVCL
ncbi:hypothetical protein GQ457_12G028610 [Hibiscus cannabinus]